ncbi:alpha/beta hydrolase fold domain-containing protein, partial [Chryseobacterium sp. Alg-005]|uniref:alpha/beta hydrolase fold domain-containing protein n=1 Tax=Chryseobacterium sp. Alg-005 TaxID=3159516 RepID=UPI0036F3674F
MKSYTNNILHRFSINLFFVSFLLAFNWGFSQNQIQPEVQKSTLLFEKTTVSEDLTYKISEKGAPVFLDVYTPKAPVNKKLPVVIYVHGGGWVEGDKAIRADSYIENMVLKLTEKQYAVISINYTLVDEGTHFPDPVEDTKDAVRWVRKNAGKYNFDTNNIGFFGTSAGAH